MPEDAWEDWDEVAGSGEEAPDPPESAPRGEREVRLLSGEREVCLLPGEGEVRLPPGEREVRLPPVEREVRLPPGEGEVRLPPGEGEVRLPPVERDDAGEVDREDGGGRVRVLTVPASLRSVDVRVGARAVRGLLLVGAVVLLVLGGRWWWVAQGAGAEPVPAGPATPVAPPSVEATGPGGQGPDHGGSTDPEAGEGSEDAETEDAESAATATTTQATASAHGAGTGAAPGGITVVVHVVGEVRRPGVVELAAGSRVADAVEAAGGLTDAADQASLNLARTLVDGEQVWVGAPGEEPPFPGVGAGGGGAGSAGGGTVVGAPPDAPPPPLDLNLATQADLEELPGIGPVTAGHILAWRDQHGRFTLVEELMEVSGIGERTFAQLEPLVSVGG